VHRQTEGNPLFVQEVVRYLAEEGLISREEGRWRVTRETPLEVSIPEGLRDVIGKRLSSLSQECNWLLSVAAVVGREFPLDTLRKVAGIEEDRFIDALKDAVGLAILEERSQVGAIRYRFTHAFFRQTLYEEIIAPQRLQLHQQVARVLETQYANCLEEHAAELAEHFAQSIDRADLAKAVSYGEMAAQRATSVYAYGEAVRLLEQALKVQEVLDPEDKAKRCDLLLTTAEALVYAGEPRRALDPELPAAFSLAEAIDDGRRASGACQLAYVALLMAGFMTTPEAAQWAERADRHAMPDTIERAWADILMGFIKSETREFTEGVRLLTRALELARRLGDLEVFTMAAGVWLTCASAPQHTQECLRLAEEVVERTQGWRGGRRPAMMRGPGPLVRTFLTSGQRIRAEEVIREHREMTERTGQVHDEIVSMYFDTVLSALDGRLEEALEMARRILNRGEEVGLVAYARQFAAMASLRPLIHLRKDEEILQTWSDIPTARSRTRALCLAHLARGAEVGEILERHVVARSGMGSIEDETPAWWDILLLEAAVLVGHRQAAELLLGRLAGTNVHTSGIWLTTCTGRHLGAAAVLLGRPEEAHAHYQEALKVATDMRFRPEIALTGLELAELLLEHYPDEKPKALEHLDFAIKEFRDMKMRPSLERALRHKESLKE